MAHDTLVLITEIRYLLDNGWRRDHKNKIMGRPSYRFPDEQAVKLTFFAPWIGPMQNSPFQGTGLLLV